MKKSKKWLIGIAATLVLLVGGFYAHRAVQTGQANAIMVRTLAKHNFPDNKIVDREQTHPAPFYSSPPVYMFTFSTKETIQRSRAKWKRLKKSGPVVGDKAPFHYIVSYYWATRDTKSAVLLEQVGVDQHPKELSQ